jgi:hypothetical protein
MHQFVDEKSNADYMRATHPTVGRRKNQNRKCVNGFGKKQAESNAAHGISTMVHPQV